MIDWLLLILILEEDFVSIIYYFKFIYFVQDLFFETGEIEILDLYGLYHIWGKCSIWYSMVIKRTDFNYFPLMCMETITKRIRLRFVYLFLCVFIILKIFGKFYTFGKSSLECFPNQNLCFDGNLCQLAPVNFALVNVKEERSHTE